MRLRLRRPQSHTEPTQFHRFVADEIECGVVDPLVRLGALETVSLETSLSEPRRALISTPLGRWAIRSVIEQMRGVAPPVAGEIGATAPSADALVTECERRKLSPQAFTEETRAYRDTHPDRAALEFATLITHAGSRMLYVTEWAVAFDPAELAPAVRKAMTPASPGGAAAGALWLMENGFEHDLNAEAPTALLEPLAWSLASMIRVGNLDDVEAAFKSDLDDDVVFGLVNVLATWDDEFAAATLQWISHRHPSKPVRKAARTAMHRRRTTAGR